MTIRYAFTTAILVLGTMIAAAAETPDVVTRIREHYRPDASIQADFDLSIYWSVREKTSKNHGSIICAPGNRFRVVIGNDVYVSDGTTCRQFSSANNQLVIRSIAQFDPSTLPSRLLATALSDYRFNETGRGGGIVTLSSRPDSSVSAAYRNVKIDVKEADGTIAVLETVDRNDNIQTYRFKKTVFGKPADAATFTFEAPTNANVIDYRK
jgi:outer membrane lipoprotein-sorting protein